MRVSVKAYHMIITRHHHVLRKHVGSTVTAELTLKTDRDIALLNGCFLQYTPPLRCLQTVDTATPLIVLSKCRRANK